MSWGFFLDLNLTLPTAEWTRVAQTTTGTHTIHAAWWGFADEHLGAMFSAADFDKTTVGDAVARFRGDESIGTVAADGDTTTLRLCKLLDRGGDPSIAKSVAALVEATKASAQGVLRMVNDGSYSGEDGVAITIANGSITREPLASSWVSRSAVFEGKHARGEHAPRGE